MDIMYPSGILAYFFSFCAFFVENYSRTYILKEGFELTKMVSKSDFWTLMPCEVSQ